jgi:hypothetical protein
VIALALSALAGVATTTAIACYLRSRHRCPLLVESTPIQEHWELRVLPGGKL